MPTISVPRSPPSLQTNVKPMRWSTQLHGIGVRRSLPSPDQALCDFAAKLTLNQNDLGSDDLAALRAQGFDDRAIHDATQVIGYFNYITRVADALGVEPEEFIRPWGQAQ